MPAALAALVAGTLVVAGCTSGPSPSGDTGAFSHLAVAPNMHTYHAPNSAGAPISLVRLSADSYLACDYSNVYRVARSGAGYVVTVLTPPPDEQVWTPAGLDYRNGLLYVANFNGADVLVLRLNGDRLELVQRMANSALGQPKHVQVDADGSVEVSDHNANQVVRFQPDGTVQWRVRVDQANGLAISGGFTYTSSLLTRMISKIDPQGRIVDAVGGVGAGVGSYLLPVDVADLGDRIAVTDAVNGRITLLDHNLKVVGHVGGNGQGLDALNYPFAVLSIPGGYVIADTYKQRLVVVDSRWTIQSQIALGGRVPTGRQRPLVFGTRDHPYTYPSLPGVDVAGELGLRVPLSFVGGYSGLDHIAAGGTTVHLDVSDRDFGDLNAAWATKVGTYIVIGSAESFLLEVIDPSNAMFTYVVVGEDNWWHSDTLLTSINLRLALTTVIAPAVALFQRVRSLMNQGTGRAVALQQLLAGRTAADLSKDLTSPAGQAFLHSPMNSADAAAYFDTVLKQPQQRVIELLEVKFLSGY